MKTLIVWAVLVLGIISAGAAWLSERDRRVSEAAASRARIEKDSAALVLAYEARARESARADAADARAMFSEAATRQVTASYDAIRNRMRRSADSARVAAGMGLPGGDIAKAERETPEPGGAVPMVSVPADFVAVADSLRDACDLLTTTCAEARETAAARERADSVIIANLTGQLGEAKKASSAAVPAPRSRLDRIRDTTLGGAVGAILGAFIGWKAAKAAGG